MTAIYAPRNCCTMPFCIQFVFAARGLLISTTAFGIIFSSHVWSTVWEAIAWPRARFAWGMIR